MSLPANVGTATVIGRFVDSAGNIPVGTVTFTPSPKRMLNVTAEPGPVTILPKSVTVELVDGMAQATLLATDDPDNNPSGWTYRVTFAISGATLEPFSLDAPEGATVDLATVAPVASADGVFIVRGETGPAGPAGTNGADGTDGVDFNRTVVQGEPALVTRVPYVADSAAPDLIAVQYDPTNSDPTGTDETLWTQWFNERGLLRLQVAKDTKWDVPLRIFGPGDSAWFQSNAFEIQQDRANGSSLAYAIDKAGRVKTSLYAWTPVTMDPARFTPNAGYYPPASRLVTDDTVELRGVIANATGALAVDDVIATLPAAHRPAFDVEVALANSTGAVGLALIRASDGAIVSKRASASGVGRISLDGQRFTRA